MDAADRVQDYNERFQESALCEQLAKGRQRAKPVVIEGETSCPDCLEPLNIERAAYGICVDCQEEREFRQKRFAR